MRRNSERKSSPWMYSIDKELKSLGFADVVDTAEIGMRDLARDAYFTPESLECFGVSRELFGKEFQGHRLIEREVVSMVDLAHPALSDALDDAIPARQDRAGVESSVGDIDGTGRRGAAGRKLSGGLGRGLDKRGAAASAKSARLIVRTRASWAVHWPPSP